VELSRARLIAYWAIQRVRERNAFAHEALQTVIKQTKPSARDKAFATRLTYGTIATRGTLDDLVATRLKSPESTPDSVRDALAIAAYELFFEGTDAYVVVDQGVELVRKASKSSRHTGLANAVLRRLAENKTTLFPGGDPLLDSAAQARLYGHPLWLAQRLRACFGPTKAGELMAINNTPAPLYLTDLLGSCHPERRGEAPESNLSEAKAGVSRGSCVMHMHAASGLSAAYHVPDQSAFWALPPEERQGLIAMDLAAQQVVELADARPGQRILEIGCGRGSKSLALAASARRKGGPAEVVGVDIYQFKIDVARKAAQQQGFTELQFLTLDATAPDAEAQMKEAGILPSFDTVLIDAPCSGLGALRRTPDKRWKLRSGDINELVMLNKTLLAQSVDFVKVGGLLLYATCTISPEENHELVKAFLETPAGGAFQLEAIGPTDVSEVFAQGISDEGFFATLPQMDGPDGHFAARLRKIRDC